MSQDRLRPLLIIWPGRFDVVERFARRLNEAIPVLDRRFGQRRRDEAPVEPDRRRAERRQPLSPDAHARFRTLGYQLVYEPSMYQEAEGDVYAMAFCGECERILEFEMPRFVEAPARVKADVRHLLSGTGTRHRVDLEALTASGGRLLACRVDARELL